MTSLSLLLASLLVAQGDAGAASDAARAAAAAEKAAQAAQIAAEAALKAAEAAARISAVVPARLEVPAAAAPAAPAAPKPAWTGTVGLGLISLSGNSKSITFTTTANGERKSEDWIFGAKLLASYGESRLTVSDGTTETTRNETVAEQAALQLRGDRRFGPRYSGYLLGAIATDHVKSVELRSSGELGASLVWVDAKGASGWATTLRTDLGFRISEERRYQYFPTPSPLDPPAVMLYAPRAGLVLTYAMSKDVLFSEEAEIMSNVYGDSRVLVNSLSKISMRLSRSLAFGVGFTVLHDSEPAAGKVATDTQLALTLDILL